MSISDRHRDRPGKTPDNGYLHACMLAVRFHNRLSECQKLGKYEVLNVPSDAL
jgi:hypothetical protein